MKPSPTMDLVTTGITVAATDLSLLLTLLLLKKWLTGQITQFINGYIDATLANIEKNPEMLAPLMDSLTKMGMKSLGITKEQSIPGMKIGGLKIPGWALQMLMPVIQGQAKKALAQTAETAAETTFG